jgi:protease YdgD
MPQPAAAQSVPFGVVGKDDRVTPDYNFLLDSGRRAVGRLEIQKADGRFYSCTFAVVGSNLGLTNTHCLLDAQGRRPRQIKAFALQYDDTVFAATNVDIFWTGLRFEPRFVQDLPKDWAIVRFKKHIGRKTGWFGSAPWSTNVTEAGQSVVGQTVDHVGYSGDWPTLAAIKPGEIPGLIPGAHFGCKLERVEFGLVVHDCDATPGASGTPIHDRQLRINALDVATVTTEAGEVINVAVPLERFMPAVQHLQRRKNQRRSIVPRP